jgi:DNA-binding PadR family transcriptional regulator
VEYAPLYKALHRLEHNDCVTGSWGISENGRRARYYKLTTHGRSRLKTEDADWRRYAAAIFRVLDPA